MKDADTFQISFIVRLKDGEEFSLAIVQRKIVPRIGEIIQIVGENMSAIRASFGTSAFVVSQILHFVTEEMSNYDAVNIYCKPDL